MYERNDNFELRQTKNKSIFFNKTNGAIKIKFNGKETDLLDLDDNTFLQLEIRDITVMLIVAEDIFIENIERVKSSNFQNKCGDWTYVQAGVGRNTADARLTKEVEEVLKDNPNCKRYAEENDTSCLWENNACIATTELDCECSSNN